MRNKIITGSLMAVGGLVLLCGGGYFWVRAAVSPEKVAQQVSKRVSSSLDRNVRIKSARLGFGWSGISVNVDSVVVEGQEEGEPPFITAANARIHLDLFPLLFKRVSVSKLELDQATITVVARPQQKENQVKPTGQMPVVLEMGGVKIARGSFVSLDQNMDTSLCITDINADLSARVSRNGQVSFKTRGSAVGAVLAPGLDGTRLAWNGSGLFDQAGDSLVISQSQLQLDQTKIALGLRATQLSGDSSKMEITLGPQEIDLSRLKTQEQLSISGGLKIDSLKLAMAKQDTGFVLAGIWGSLDGSGLTVKTSQAPEPVKFSKLRARFSGDNTKIEISASSGRTRLNLSGKVVLVPRIYYFLKGKGSLFMEDFSPDVAGKIEFSLRTKGTPEAPVVGVQAKITHLKTSTGPDIRLLQLDALYTGDSLILNDLQVESRPMRLRASGRADLKNNSGDFSVHATRIDLDQLLPEGDQTSQQAKGSSDFTPDLLPKGNLLISADLITLRGERFRNFNARISSTDQAVSAEYLRASVYGGTLQGKASITNKKPQKAFISVSLNSIDLARFFKKHDPFGAKMQGRASFFLEGSFLPDNPQATLDMKASATLSKGSVQSSGLLKRLSDYTGIPQLAQLQHNGASGRFTIKNGWINIDGVSFSSGDLGLMLNGRASLQKELDLDCVLDVDLTKVKEIAPRLSKLIIPTLQSASFYISITGTLDDPNFEITGANVGEAIKQSAEKGLEQGKQKAQEEWEKGKQKAQEEWEKGKQKAKEEWEKGKQKAKEKWDEKTEEWKKKFGF